MIYSYEITHNKETNDFNGHNAQQFIVTLGTNAEAGDIEGILEKLFEQLMKEEGENKCVCTDQPPYQECLEHSGY